MATQVAAKIIGIVAATSQSAAYNGGRRRGGAGDGLLVRVATSGVRAYDARRKPTVNGASNGDLISSNSIWCPSVCLLLPLYVSYIGFLNCCLDLLDIVTTSP